MRSIAALILCPLLLACGQSVRDPRIDLLVLTLDTTRADHLGCYGYLRDTSPEIDALARESILFENAVAPMASTLPTHLSLFTATAPLEHGVLNSVTRAGRRFVPAPRVRSLASIAGEAGYDTAAFVSAAPLTRGSGVESGFATFDEPSERQRAGGETIDAAIAWLELDREAPFFLWVHLYDAHWPYEVPPPYKGSYATDAALERWIAERRIPDQATRPGVGKVNDCRAVINAYDGAIRYQNAELGRLLRWLRDEGRQDETAVLLLGDHGEGLCQHGHPAHDGTWAEQLRAPLLMRVPGIGPRRLEPPISLVDALPTFLALVGVPGLRLPEGQASGRDLLADDASATPILSQDTALAPDAVHRFALTSSRWKYFRVMEGDGSVRDELYDLHADPFELEDLASRHPKRVAELRGFVEARTREQIARGEALREGHPVATRPVDPELLHHLEALGYLPAADPTQRDETAR